MMLSVGHFLQALTQYEAAGDEPLVASVELDSRHCGPGSLFLAFRGENVDGHDFVEQAFAKGAIAAVVETPQGDFPVIDCRNGGSDHAIKSLPVQLQVADTLTALQTVATAWRMACDVRVIGITGSVGKTTTKELVDAVLTQRFTTLKSPGNFNSEIGLPLTLLQLDDSHERIVLEMGMYVPGDIKLLCDIARPDVGVLTLIGTVHMERAGSQQALIEGKRELVEALSTDGVAILNADDPNVLAMAKNTAARVQTYGLTDSADLWADDIESMGLQGVRFTMHHDNEALRVQIPLLGRHSVQTALRAALVGLVEGLSWDEVVAGLHSHRDQLRLLVVDGPEQSVILDDTYNASPESTLAALNLLADLDGRHVAILGDMLELGSAEAEGHDLVGRRAAVVANVLVAVGKRGQMIGNAALAAGMAADNVYFAESADLAIDTVRGLIEPQDMILVKGSRGAQLDRITSALQEAVA